MRDVFTCNTAGVERTHRKLRTRLTNGLCRDDASSRADVDRTRSREVPAIALLANAVLCMAGHDAAVNERLDTRIHERLQLSHRIDVRTCFSKHFASVRISDRIDQATANERIIDLALSVQDLAFDAIGGTAIDLANDDVLRIRRPDDG